MSDVRQRLAALTPKERASLERRLREKSLPAATEPIRRRRGKGPAPLSFAQERLWLLDRLDPSTAAYNIGQAFRLRGPVNAEALGRALQTIQERHEVLRSVFVAQDGNPVQVVAATVALPVVDLDGEAQGAREAQALRIAEEESRRPFDLEVGPLVRTKLLRLSEQDHVLVVTTHHIVFDGWSSEVFWQELSALYEAYREGRPSPLPEPSLQYADFAVWQREWLTAGMLEEQQSYWRGRLDGAPAVLELPGRHSRPSGRSLRTATESIWIPGPVAEAVRRVGQEEGATLFMTLLAAFQILLLRLTGQEDLVVGTPVAGRNRSEVERLIGFFVNTLVLRTDLSGDPTFRELLRRVRGVALDALAHQDLPFEKLVEALQPKRDLSRTPIFQVFFNMLNYGAAKLRLAGVQVERIEIPPPCHFDLTLYAEEMEEGVRFLAVYDPDLLESVRVSQMLEQLSGLLAQIAAAPLERIRSYSLLTDSARRVLPDPTTPLPEPETAVVAEDFLSWSDRAPSAAAVAQGGRVWSYGDLERSSRRVAESLLGRGLAPGDVVGVAGRRSFGLIASMLGVLRSGGVLLTLDPALPAERRRLMLSQAHARYLVRVGRSAPEELETGGAPLRVLAVDREGHPSPEEPHAAGGSLPRVSADDPAYIFFTSGTSGVPKAVLGTQKGLSHFLRWQRETFAVGPGDRCAQLTSLSFDVVLRDVFLPLSSGASVHLPDASEEVGSSRILDWIGREEITLLHTVPSLAQSWLAVAPAQGSPARLRWTFFAGEPLSDALVRRWRRAFPNAGRIVNLYGPTETTLVKCFSVVPEEPPAGIQPVGRPLPDTQALILLDGRRLCGIGEVGEIVLRTPFRTLGYLNAPLEQQERFVPNPFRSESGDVLYKTGDRGRYRPDGSLEILGRWDDQVKIRGVRVEPAEVAAALSGHPAVEACAVIACPDVAGESTLVAYVVCPRQGPQVTAELRGYLSRHLPAAMVPSAVVFLPELPMTPNGKLDRAALASPDPAERAHAEPPEMPRTPVEEVVATTWGSILRLEGIGIREDFFGLGGHSLKAAQVMARLSEVFRIDLPVRQIFENPTIASLATAIENVLREEWQRAARGDAPVDGATRQNRSPVSGRPGGISGRADPRAPAPLSFGQERLWVLDRLDPGLASYNISRAFRLRGPLDVDALERALETVEQRHEILRSVFVMESGGPVQVVMPPRRQALSVVEPDGLSEGIREEEVRRMAEEESRRPFDLSRGPLVRTKLLRLSGQESVLVTTMHHSVFDGWSGEIFLSELSALYEAYRQGRPSPLPELSLQYADFAVWQREWLQGGVLEEQVKYWKRRLEGAPALLELPESRSRPLKRSFRGATETISIPERVSRAIRGLGQPEGATLFMTLLAAFEVLLMRHSGQEDVVVGTPVAGRNRSEIEGLIGFFVNTLVLRTDVSGDPTFRELLGRVREGALEAYAHQDLPFEKLVEQVNPERTLSYSPIFQVMLVLQDAAGAAFGLSGISVTPLPLETSTSKFDLTAFFTDTGGPIEVSFQYSTDLFEASTIKRMLAHLEVLLEGIVEDPDSRVSRLPLMGEQERHLVLEEWNRTEAPYPDKTVGGLFEEQVERTPEAVAVEMEGEGLTYGQLNERANRLARHLQGLGVGPEVLVGLCVERSVEMVVGLLGILKAGGAYLPLDPGYPRERLRFLVEDGGPRLVLTHRDLGGRLPEGVEQVRLDADWGQIQKQSGENPQSRATPDNLAYIIYTSGSTGKPKGVRIPHRGVVRLVRGTDFAKLGPEEVFLQFAPISFDASTFEIWGALANGGRLVVMPPGIVSPDELGAAIERHAVTTLWLTAGLFHQMVETQIGRLRGVRQLIAGGDVLSVARVEKALRELPDCRLVNGYGPTEGTTFTCCHTLSRGEELGSTVPIGKPIANTRVFILDPYLQPVPIGVAGELAIAGDGLARDYLGAPGLTAEKFVPDPFGGPGDRLYRSGDRARYRDDGTIEFLGRMDDQVKVRGFRVEPGEVEAALLRDPSLREVCVALREDSPGERRLVAYVSGETGASEGVPRLRARLKESLPDFMIPSAFVFLDSLPLTPNGKVDRAALPAPGSERPRLEKESVAARNDLEARLVAIWEQVLGVRPIGVTDNFFDLGGHSLLAARLFSEIERELGHSLALSTIFRAQTIVELAGILEEGRAKRPALSLVAIQPKGSRPPFFCVHAVWGNVFHYRELARRLGRDQPVYGFQARGLDGKTPPCETVEEMAANYIEELRAFQPEGPYRLGGHSFGGLVAYEMARQLHARGQRVSLLALFDTSSRPVKRGRTPFEFVQGRARFHATNLKAIPSRERAGYLLRRAGALAVVAGRSLSLVYERIFDPVRAARRRVYQANLRAASRYVPAPYPGRVTLLCAADRWRRLNDGRPPADPQLGWGKLCGEGVDVREVPGDHASMLEDGENVQPLAEVLSDCLRQAREGQ